MNPSVIKDLMRNTNSLQTGFKPWWISKCHLKWNGPLYCKECWLRPFYSCVAVLKFFFKEKEINRHWFKEIVYYAPVCFGCQFKVLSRVFKSVLCVLPLGSYNTYLSVPEVFSSYFWHSRLLFKLHERHFCFVFASTNLIIWIFFRWVWKGHLPTQEPENKPSKSTMEMKHGVQFQVFFGPQCFTSDCAKLTLNWHKLPKILGKPLLL